MTVILMDRIPELILIAVDVLCPIFTVLASVYLTFVCLGFNDKYTIYGYDYVVDLCCISVVCDEKIVNDFIFVFMKALEHEGHSLFT